MGGGGSLSEVANIKISQMQARLGQGLQHRLQFLVYEFL